MDRTPVEPDRGRLRLSCMMSIKNRVGGLAAVAMIVLLAGCSSGGSEAGAASMAEPAAGGAAAGSDAAGDTASSVERAAVAPDAAKNAPANSAAGGSALPSGAQVVRTASQTLRVDDVRAAAARARTATTALGGYVAAENLNLGSPGADPVPIDSRTGASSSLTLRVPEKSADTALDRLATIGKELNRTSTADDVTAQVADLDSRLATRERSVKRVRELLDRASSLKDVVLLESELSRREEDLEAAQASSRALHDQATLATINLDLVSNDSPLPPADDDGFLHGLASGWDALARSTVAVLTGLGAVLPFAVVLGLIGVPAYLVWRRRQGVAPASVPATAPAGSPDPSPDQP